MSNKKKTEIEKDSNSTVESKLRRYRLRCGFCRPNKGENAKTYRKHGVKKPKSKDHR